MKKTGLNKEAWKKLTKDEMEIYKEEAKQLNKEAEQAEQLNEEN